MSLVLTQQILIEKKYGISKAKEYLHTNNTTMENNKLEKVVLKIARFMILMT